MHPRRGGSARWCEGLFVIVSHGLNRVSACLYACECMHVGVHVHTSYIPYVGRVG